MQFQLHNDYVNATAPRPEGTGRRPAAIYQAEPPPRRMRAQVARVLVGAAERVDRESVRRTLA